jgi:hypothetical protein
MGIRDIVRAKWDCERSEKAQRTPCYSGWFAMAIRQCPDIHDGRYGKLHVFLNIL